MRIAHNLLPFLLLIALTIVKTTTANICVLAVVAYCNPCSDAKLFLRTNKERLESWSKVVITPIVLRVGVCDAKWNMYPSNIFNVF